MNNESSKFIKLSDVLDMIVPGVEIYKQVKLGKFEEMSWIGDVFQVRLINDVILIEVNEENSITLSNVPFQNNLEPFYVKVKDFVQTLARFNSSEGLTFGQATQIAKLGYAVQRSGWNGKGMFVCVMPPLKLEAYNNQDTEKRVNDRTAKYIGEDTPLDVLPYWSMFTADKKWLPGWLSSQSDTLASDWTVFVRD